MSISDQEIMQVALDLFSHKGYTSVSTREIAQSAGITEMTLFRKFESKKKLFIRSIKDEWNDEYPLKSLDAISCDDRKEAFGHLSRLLIETFQRNSRVTKILINSPEVQDPEFLALSKENITRFQGDIQRFLARLIERPNDGQSGNGENAESGSAMLATQLVAMIMGFFMMKEVMKIEMPVSWDSLIQNGLERFGNMFFAGPDSQSMTVTHTQGEK